MMLEEEEEGTTGRTRDKEEEEGVVITSTTGGGSGGGDNGTASSLQVSFINNGNGDHHHIIPSSGRSSPGIPSPSACGRCKTLELEIGQVKSNFETDFARLRKEVEMANKAKESIVMKYATSEVEVLKMKKTLDNSEKVIKHLNSEMEIANKKQKMLSSERERLTCMVDAKFHEIEDLYKEISRMKEDMSSKEFKVTWTQNKLREEEEAHTNTRQTLEARIKEMQEELESVKVRAILNGHGDADENKFEEDGRNVENQSQTSPDFIEEYKQLVQQNESLEAKIRSFGDQNTELCEKISKLEESNIKHLHQIAALESDLNATERLKVQLEKEAELNKVLESECEELRQAHAEVLNDMAICRTKEAELLGYTQEVTEKNVTLQATLSSTEARNSVLNEENERLRTTLTHLESERTTSEDSLSRKYEKELEEKEALKRELTSSKEAISKLQQQLDEARGEISVLNRKMNSSVRELSKELYVARKQAKESHAGSDELSQSSRASSESSLANGDYMSNQDKQIKSEEQSQHETPVPMIPDQQVLIEKIAKLQRTLAKKQDKMEFLQEHVKQLVDQLQKKSRVIQGYAMSQDIEALSSNLAEQCRAEILKHRGIMASVYGSKPADEGMTLDLSLEMNRKMQVVLEDTLLRNMTLKDSMNTLGKEISRLTEENQNLSKKLKEISK